MTPLELKLKDILYLVSSVIEDDNNRNYGDRDVGINKLKNHWEDFIELHPNSEDPYLLSLRDKIKIDE